jgi:hypothetical protein
VCYSVTAAYSFLSRICFLPANIVPLFVSRSLPSNGPTRCNSFRQIQKHIHMLHPSMNWLTQLNALTSTYLHREIATHKIIWVTANIWSSFQLQKVERSFQFFFKFLGVGWDWVHLVHQPLFGLLYLPRMIDDDCGAVGGMRIVRGNRNTGRKPASVSLCPSQIPHDLTYARTRSAAVGSWRLTAWAMVRPIWMKLVGNKARNYWK